MFKIILFNLIVILSLTRNSDNNPITNYSENELVDLNEQPDNVFHTIRIADSDYSGQEEPTNEQITDEFNDQLDTIIDVMANSGTQEEETYIPINMVPLNSENKISDVNQESSEKFESSILPQETLIFTENSLNELEAAPEIQTNSVNTETELDLETNQHITEITPEQTVNAKIEIETEAPQIQVDTQKEIINPLSETQEVITESILPMKLNEDIETVPETIQSTLETTDAVNIPETVVLSAKMEEPSTEQIEEVAPIENAVETVAEETMAPIEQAIVQETLPIEQTASEIIAPIQNTIETVPSETLVEETVAPIEQSIVQEVLPIEQTASEIIAPIQNTIETVPSETLVEETVAPIEQSIVQEVLPIEETASEIIAPIQNTIEEQPISETITPVEEAVALQEIAPVESEKFITAEQTLTNPEFVKIEESLPERVTEQEVIQKSEPAIEVDETISAPKEIIASEIEQRTLEIAPESVVQQTLREEPSAELDNLMENEEETILENQKDLIEESETRNDVGSKTSNLFLTKKIADENIVDTIIEEPVAQTVAAEPVAQTVAAEPVAQTVAAESVAQTVAAEPIAQTVAAEPVAQTVAAEPIAQTVAAEPEAIADIIPETVVTLTEPEKIDEVIQDEQIAPESAAPISEDIEQVVEKSEVIPETIETLSVEKNADEQINDNSNLPAVAETISEPVQDELVVKEDAKQEDVQESANSESPIAETQPEQITKIKPFNTIKEEVFNRLQAVKNKIAKIEAREVKRKQKEAAEALNESVATFEAQAANDEQVTEKNINDEAQLSGLAVEPVLENTNELVSETIVPSTIKETIDETLLQPSESIAPEEIVETKPEIVSDIIETPVVQQDTPVISEISEIQEDKTVQEAENIEPETIITQKAQDEISTDINQEATAKIEAKPEEIESETVLSENAETDSNFIENEEEAVFENEQVIEKEAKNNVSPILASLLSMKKTNNEAESTETNSENSASDLTVDSTQESSVSEGSKPIVEQETSNEIISEMNQEKSEASSSFLEKELEKQKNFVPETNKAALSTVEKQLINIFDDLIEVDDHSEEEIDLADEKLRNDDNEDNEDDNEVQTEQSEDELTVPEKAIQQEQQRELVEEITPTADQVISNSTQETSEIVPEVASEEVETINPGKITETAVPSSVEEKLIEIYSNLPEEQHDAIITTSAKEEPETINPGLINEAPIPSTVEEKLIEFYEKLPETNFEQIHEPTDEVSNIDLNTEFIEKLETTPVEEIQTEQNENVFKTVEEDSKIDIIPETIVPTSEETAIAQPEDSILREEEIELAPIRPETVETTETVSNEAQSEIIEPAQITTDNKLSQVEPEFTVESGLFE